MEFEHKPIMVGQILELLGDLSGKAVIDCTLGGGGHSEAFLQAGASVTGIDRDLEAIAAASKRLERFGERFRAVHGNYTDIKTLAGEKAYAILADLGVSSYQLDNPTRGFCYNQDAPLDMRMDQSCGMTAADVVNGYSEAELARVIYSYGEERWAKRIAQFIVKESAKEKIETTGRLDDIIHAAIPAAARRDGPHPSKRTFQALRIEVNGELESLKDAVSNMSDMLLPGGRLAVITFHSLEDRLVKREFLRMANPCTCPPKTPVCICGKTPTMKLITRHVVTCGGDELTDNPRARSAKLRVAERL